MNPYKVLGVTPSMDIESIHIKYKQLAKKYHPDGSHGDAERFKQINEAWKLIKSKKVDIRLNSASMVTHKTLFTFRRIQK